MKGCSGTVYLEPQLPIPNLPKEKNSLLLQASFTSETWAEKVNLQAFASRAGTSVPEAKFTLKTAKIDFMTPARSSKRQQVEFDNALTSLQATGVKARKLNPILDTIQEKAAGLIATRRSEGKTEPNLN